MSAQLDFPIIAPEPTAVANQAQTVREAALAHFSALEAPLRTLAERYRAVAFDCSTAKGMEAAKKARHDLRENGRFAVQRAEAAFKTAVNDAKKAVDGKADELVAIVRPVEDAIDAQIKAREEQVERERQERAVAEAARQQKHRDAIAVIAGYVAKAEGLPSARIQAGIEYVRTIDVSAEVFEDFADRAAEQKSVTIERLEAMLARTLAAEEAARRAEAQRIENERVAAELAEQRRQLAEQAEALRKAQAAAQLHSEARDSQQVLKAEPATADATDRDAPATASPRVGAMGVGQAADAAPAVEARHVQKETQAPPHQQDAGDPPAGADCAGRGEQPEVIAAPAIKLGDICERLGFTVTAAFVTETLGIKSCGTDKRAVLFAQADFHRIIDALIAHLNVKKASY